MFFGDHHKTKYDGKLVGETGSSSIPEEDCHGEHSQHHVNHIIMSTNHYQVVGKCNSLGPCELKWLPWSPKYRASVPQLRVSIWESCPQKVWRSVARAPFALEHVTTLRCRGHLKDGVGKHAQDCSKSSVSHKSAQKGYCRSSPSILHCQRCENICRFSAMLLLCGFATGCDETHWHGCPQRSMSDGCDAPGKRDCS